MAFEVPDLFFGTPSPTARHGNRERGLLTEKGLKRVIACVEAMKGVLGDEVGLALDCGPGWTVPDAIRLARAVEPLNIAWLEDLITGDYVPYVDAASSATSPRPCRRRSTPASRSICARTSNH
jgi:L-alanine-DL-glutamate epimerase-like enolase superfamily enzyme